MRRGAKTFYGHGGKQNARIRINTTPANSRFQVLQECGVTSDVSPLVEEKKARRVGKETSAQASLLLLLLVHTSPTLPSFSAPTRYVPCVSGRSATRSCAVRRRRRRVHTQLRRMCGMQLLASRSVAAADQAAPRFAQSVSEAERRVHVERRAREW